MKTRSGEEHSPSVQSVNRAHQHLYSSLINLCFFFLKIISIPKCKNNKSWFYRELNAGTISWSEVVTLKIVQYRLHRLIRKHVLLGQPGSLILTFLQNCSVINRWKYALYLTLLLLYLPDIDKKFKKTTKKNRVYKGIGIWKPLSYKKAQENNVSIFLKDSLSHLGEQSHKWTSFSPRSPSLYTPQTQLEHTFVWAMSQSCKSLKITLWLPRILCCFILSASKVSLWRRWRQHG